MFFFLYVLLVFKGLKCGFASKSMVESKNLKLKLGLCGLALTSFLALNARGNTVHADTVNGSNADAITWDADDDDSQVVKNETQQSQPTRNVQVKQSAQRASVRAEQKRFTVQSVQSVQSQAKVAQPIQKQAVVQSSMQNRQSQPKMAVANVSSTVSTPNRAEHEFVRQSNAETSTANRLIADHQRNYANVKVARLDATAHSQGTNVDISANPMKGDNRITVHYVDMHGRNIKGVDDDTIWNITYPTVDNKPYNPDGIASGKYNVPKGYNLVNPNGTYSWINYPTNFATRQWAFPKETSTDSRYFSESDAIEKLNAGNGAPTQAEINNANKILATLGNSAMKAIPDAVGDDINNLDKNDNCIRVTANTHDGTRYIAFDIAHPDRSYGDSTTVYYEFMENGDIDIGYTKLSDNKFDTSGFNTLYNFIAKYADDCIINTYTELDDWRFKDNSGNARQGATADTVNVMLTKPASVDPNSRDCKRQAQRVIHVAFPNGVKPKSYDSITDSAGNKLTLDSSNNLTQTVTFTRTKTIDGLTGTTLSQTSWQQHGAINAVTLPAIPGYTMVTTN